jgi:hypothetical protein
LKSPSVLYIQGLKSPSVLYLQGLNAIM